MGRYQSPSLCEPKSEAFRENRESGNALDPIPGNVEFDDSNMPAGKDPGTLSAWVNLDSVPQNTGSVIQWGSAGVTQFLV